MVDSGKTLFCHQVRRQPELLSILVPLLQSIVMLPDEVSPNLMVKNSFHCVVSVLDRQAYHDSAHAIAVVVDDACWGNCVLDEFVGKQIGRI